MIFGICNIIDCTMRVWEGLCRNAVSVTESIETMSPPPWWWTTAQARGVNVTNPSGGARVSVRCIAYCRHCSISRDRPGERSENGTDLDFRDIFRAGLRWLVIDTGWRAVAAAAALGHVGLISEQLLTWASCSLVKHVTIKICSLRSLTNNDWFHRNLSHPNCIPRHIARSSFKFSDCSFSLTLINI